MRENFLETWIGSLIHVIEENSVAEIIKLSYRINNIKVYESLCMIDIVVSVRDRTIIRRENSLTLILRDNHERIGKVHFLC